MWLNVFLIFLILGALFFLARMFWRHLPDLKNLDVNSIRDERQDAAKAKILEAKFFRSSHQVRKKLDRIISPPKSFLAVKFDQWKRAIVRLEEHYQEEPLADEDKNKTLPELLAEAGRLKESEDFAAAERKLIEVISRDNKNIAAYEILGDLYLDSRNYIQAEEIFKYLIKLSTVGQQSHKKGKFEEAETAFLGSLAEVDPKLAVYYDDLGSLYELTGKSSRALDCFLKASSVEPNNPKYLDKLIELGIKLKDRGLAKRTFNRLKEINPENAKLADFKEAIEKL